jgi:hypothetical protein
MFALFATMRKQKLIAKALAIIFITFLALNKK